MKKLFIILSLTIATISAHSAPTLLLNGTYNTLTTNSPAISQSIPVSGPAIWAYNGAGAATNTIQVNQQISLDNTNWTTVVIYYPAGGPATTQCAGLATNVTIYTRTQVITTNSVNLNIITAN